MKNPTITTLLNIIPGVGYFYVGRKRVFALLVIIGTVLTSVASYLNPLMEQYYNSMTYGAWDWVALLGTLSIVAAFMYDGYRETIIHNSQLSKKSLKTNA